MMRTSEVEDSEFGYLMVHFVEDPDGHGERIFFSLSERDDPTRWRRLNGGKPVLESREGTTGVRDPFIVKGEGEYFIVATDLRIYGGDERGWDAWRRTGSRKLIVWRSTNLAHWSAPWALEVAPPEAGMAWAPEAIYDTQREEFLVYWSSTLFGPDDPEHTGSTYSCVLGGWTPDFRSVSAPQMMIDRGVDVIDTTIVVDAGEVHRISKEDSGLPASRRLFHEVGSGFFADDFTLVAERIADEAYRQVEGPLLFANPRDGRWYLFVDQFERRPQGYVALTTEDLHAGWTLLPAEDFHIPADTKHGSVLRLRRSQWDLLRTTYPPAVLSSAV